MVDLISQSNKYKYKYKGCESSGGLVSRQTRVQLPDSYICAKLVDFETTSE